MVKKLIHQFDSHPNRDSLMEDLNKTDEFYQFSEHSEELISSVGNKMYFELCEIFSKIQCSDRSLYWDVGIVHCTCGKCPQSSERNRQLNKDRYDVLSITSITSYVIKKNPSHETRHGATIWHSAVLFWKGGTKTISAEVLCLKLGGMKKLLRPTTMATPTLRPDRKEV